MKPVKVAIIGSGPSGYTAAIYNARARLEPVLFAGEKSGGQLMWTTDIENFPGFGQGIAGPELMAQMRAQAERFGTQIRDEYVTAVDLSQRPFKIWTNIPDGATGEDFEKRTPQELADLTAKIKQAPHALLAEAIIISTGAVARMMGVPGEEKFLGRGVSTCAVCDAAFFKDKKTFVVGGGDSAMEDTLSLVKFASEVTVIHRRDEFRASQIMQERVLNHDKVKVMWNSSVKEIRGQNKLEKLLIESDGQEIEVQADGVFLAIGHKPVSAIFADQIELDNHGYIITRQSPTQLGIKAAKAAVDGQLLLPFPSMTSVEGVFAAGDVVDMRYQQAITAAGQGCSAALDVERWLEANL